MAHMKWKILYTDGTKIGSDDMTPEQIPNVRRAGVHSIAQAVDADTMRDTLEASYYGWSKSKQLWIPLRQEDVFDWLLTFSSLEDLGALLAGRIQTFDEYNALRMEFREDPDVILPVVPTPIRS